jgi:hypothetical protein
MQNRDAPCCSLPLFSHRIFVALCCMSSSSSTAHAEHLPLSFSFGQYRLSACWERTFNFFVPSNAHPAFVIDTDYLHCSTCFVCCVCADTIVIFFFRPRSLCANLSCCGPRNFFPFPSSVYSKLPHVAALNRRARSYSIIEDASSTP